MRGRAPVGRWAIAAILLVVGGAAAVASARPLARLAVIELLERAGLPVRTLELRALGLRSAELGPIELGSGDGPAAASARASWSLSGLLAGRIDRVTIRQPKVAVTLGGDSIEVRGLPDFAARSGHGPAPIRRLDIVNGTLAATTPVGEIVATLDASLASVDAGFRLERLTVRRAALPLAAGTLSVADLDYRRGRPLDGTLDVRGIDMEALFKLLDVDGLSGSGVLAGAIPIHVDASGVRIEGGALTATRPGVLRYAGGALPAQAVGADRQASEGLKLVRQALADFHYETLSLDLERAPSGEGTLMAKLEGANPAVLDGHPFAINVRFETNFDKLATILLEGYAAAARLLRAERPR